ncbi:unnamed protein product [Rotaria sp. Silwood1]|nr:unnamed protein product [Rotaria sp. Silwood1]
MQCSSTRTTGKPSSTYSSTMPTALIILLIMMSVFFFGLCLSCCITLKRKQRQQRTRAPTRTRDRQRIIYRYRQEPSRVVQSGSTYTVNTASLSPPTLSIYEEPPPSFVQISSLYEESPPSYEAAIADLSFKDQLESSPLPSVTAIVEIERTRL